MKIISGDAIERFLNLISLRKLRNIQMMNATFVELPAFEKYRENYINDDSYKEFQQLLIENPSAGDVIENTGGLRKIRFADKRRQKGKRGGIRIIYYWWDSHSQFWLFTLYDKNEASDLTVQQKKILKGMLEAELRERTSNERT